MILEIFRPRCHQISETIYQNMKSCATKCFSKHLSHNSENKTRNKHLLQLTQNNKCKEIFSHDIISLLQNIIDHSLTFNYIIFKKTSLLVKLYLLYIKSSHFDFSLHTDNHDVIQQTITKL